MSTIQFFKLAAPVAVASVVLCGCGSASTSGSSPSEVGDATVESGTDDGGNGVADGGSPHGGADVENPSLCDPAKFLFCDGFEDNGGLLNWSQTFASGGIPMADTTHVYRGSYALRAHVDATTTDAGANAYAYVQQIQEWPTHVFVRYFAYQPSPHPASASSLVDMLQAGSPYPGIEMLTEPPSGGLAMKTYSTGHDQLWASDGGALAPDQWVCFELELDSGAGTAHLYMNDVEVTDLARTGLGLPPFGILGVGLSFLQAPQAAQDVWIDEVAVNGTRIGCAN